MDNNTQDELLRAMLGSGDPMTSYGNLPTSRTMENQGFFVTGDPFDAAVASQEQVPVSFLARQPQGASTSYNNTARTYKGYRSSNMPLYDENGAINMRRFQWNSSTYMVPVSVPASAPQETRAICVQHTIANIRSARSEWSDKTGALAACFSGVGAETAKNLGILKLANLKNNYLSPIFHFQFQAIRRADGANQNIPAADTPAFRSNSFYGEFMLTVRPSLAQSNYSHGSTTVPDSITTVYIRLPRLVNPVNHTEELHPHLTVENIQLVPAIVQASSMMGWTNAMLGQLKDGTFQQESFNKWLDKIYHQTLFEELAENLYNNVVGEGALRSPEMRLQKCRMETQDPVTGKRIVRKVEEHFNLFQNIVSELDNSAPFPINIPQVYFHTLTETLQEEMKLSGVRVDELTPHSNQEALQMLTRVKDKAVEASDKIHHTVGLFQKYNEASKRMRPSTFLSTNIMPNTGETEQHGRAPQQYELGQFAMSSLAPATSQLTTIMLAAKDQAFNMDCDIRRNEPACIFLSTAEQAIIEASGMTVPVQCWGCSTFPEFASQSFHLWTNCPHKHDARVQAAAQEKIQEVRKKWKEQRASRTGTLHYVPPKTKDSWKKVRVPAQQATLIAKIADDQELPEVRHACYSQLINIIRNTSSEPKDQTDPSTGTASGQFHQLVSLVKNIKVMAALPVQTQLPITITAHLPHMQLPLGFEEGNLRLLCAVDSCGALNMGHLPFHRSIARLYPELVHYFKPWNELTKAEQLSIGGINNEDVGVSISHVISYKTPFRYNGTASTVTLGLCNTVAATALLGYPFLKHGKCTWDFGPDKLHVGVWAADFDIVHQVPTLRDIPLDRVMDGVAHTFMFHELQEGAQTNWSSFSNQQA